MKKILTFILLLVSLNTYAMPPTTYYTSIADDDWETAATWDQAGAPSWDQTTGTDDITINTNVLLSDNFTLKSGTVLTINAGDTLTITGNAWFNNGSVMLVNGVLIIQGSVTNSNNSDDITINGVIIIGGDYDGGTGSTIGGTGEMEIDGSIDTSGDGTVFGSETDCTVDCDNSSAEPLPIELVFFRLDEIDEGIRLEWLTATEINNDFFEVSESTNGVEWNLIATIKGAGNSNSPLTYSFVDNKIFSGYNYYKLSQTDYDGTQKEFDIISHLNISERNIRDIGVYPNPATTYGNVNVSLNGFNGEEVLIVIMDILGNVFYEKAIIVDSENSVTIINSKLAVGTYLVIGSNKQELYKRKLVIK